MIRMVSRICCLLSASTFERSTAPIGANINGRSVGLNYMQTAGDRSNPRCC